MDVRSDGLQPEADEVEPSSCSDGDPSRHISIHGCPDATVKAFKKTANQAHSMLCDILKCLDTPEHTSAIKKCFSDQGLDDVSRVKEMIAKTARSFPRRTVECVCCDKLSYKTSGPFHTPNPGLLGSWEGQPIRICTDRANQEPFTRYAMSHELLRWWVGDSKWSNWNNVNYWDDAMVCAFNYAIGKCGSTAKAEK
jgi:hypothetical protein